MSELTRRRLLAASGGLAAGSLGLLGWTVLRQPQAQVLALRCHSYDDDLLGHVKEGIQAFPRALAAARGGRVVLKPNLVEVHPGRPVNTHPALITAAAAAFLELGAREVIVAEGPGHVRDIEAILELSGLDEALRPLKVPFRDLNVDTAVELRPSGNHTDLGRLSVARTVMDADLLVSMPKLKTHHWAGATLSMKNLFGIVPGAVVGWPKNPLHWAGIPNSIVDLWTIARPGLAIVDGIVGMEGDGPIMGTAIEHGLLLFGEQCPAVDSVAATAMGIDPTALSYLRLATREGGTLSPLRITRMGDALPIRPYALLDKFAHIRAAGV